MFNIEPKHGEPIERTIQITIGVTLITLLSVLGDAYSNPTPDNLHFRALVLLALMGFGIGLFCAGIATYFRCSVPQTETSRWGWRISLILAAGMFLVIGVRFLNGLAGTLPSP